MNKQQISSVIVLILSKIGVSKNRVSRYSEFSQDFGFGEAEYNLFLNYLESYFGISVTSKDESDLLSVNNTVQYVHNSIIGR